MKCKSCKSKRIASITGKCSDCCTIAIGEYENDGYVPDGLNVGSGDYIDFSWCLDCGKIMGDFPISNERTEELLND